MDALKILFNEQSTKLRVQWNKGVAPLLTITFSRSFTLLN